MRTASAAEVTWVATNSVWHLFRGTSDPSPGVPTGWTRRDFDDTQWTPSAATFFYGEPGFTGTDLTGMSGNYSTIFLRRHFTIEDPAALEDIELRAICDDGFVAYLNGVRVASERADASDPRFNSLAVGNAPEPVTYQDYPLANANALVAGDNVLAVVVLNTSLGSSDLVFAAELGGSEKTPSPPTLTSVNPLPGLVTNLTQITVIFSEPVNGVAAQHFLINGTPATGMTGSGTTYTFTFPQPPFGMVGISWGPLHQIHDLDNPPTAFSGTAPGSAWAYELLDPAGPAMTTRRPEPGTPLRFLGAIEVSFNRPVIGLDAADLQLNGQPASHVTGIGAGPYRFEFDPGATAGTATLSWTPNHGITSDEPVPHPFSGGSWSYGINPSLAVPEVVINEVLADNLNGRKDEDDDPEDWVELWNSGNGSVNLGGWALSDGNEPEDEWVLPSVILPARGYLLIWASGKDRAGTGPRGELHAHFKLNPHGDRLRLLSPELPRRPLDEVVWDRQGSDFSFGRQTEGNTSVWRYFATPTPGTANGFSSVTNQTAAVHFSAERGFYDSPFRLSLACETPGATIRYTTNGSPPNAPNGFVYTDPIPIASSRVIRAAALAPNQLPSAIRTHTYLYGLSPARRSLPALSLVSATNNLFGRTGIMEFNPRNTDKHGPAWERPVSVEYLRPEDNGGFQIDAGLRLQGGGYIRGLYNYKSTSIPESKYSFRLYFRGEYGAGRLNYPLFPTTTVQSFDTIVLRAGMNDPTNPFLKDEYARQLGSDMGQPAAHGTFVHLFLNGVYKGYYNPTERIDVDFFKAYQGGGDRWDVVAQLGEVRDGDGASWNQLLNLAQTRPPTTQANYLEFARRMDLTNFVDYLLPNIFMDTDDWPHNNWRAAREISPSGRWRFYMWDAEFSFGQPNGHAPSFNTITGQLSSLAPPWGTTEIQRLFNALKRSREFQLLFADRAHRALFNRGPLADANLRTRYEETKTRLNATRTVSGFNNSMINNWINSRRRYVLGHLGSARFNGSTNAPGLNQLGRPVPAGFQLVLTNVSGNIYYTTDGTDPRVAFTEAVAPQAQTYTTPLVLNIPLRLKARSLEGTTNWSALTETTFQIAQAGVPLRFTELMYNPPGGDPYEFIELMNFGGAPLDVAGFSFEGVTFRFPVPFPQLAGGGRLVLANASNPAAFATRYPGVAVAGYYDGALSNGGERVAVLDRNGRVIESVTYGDDGAWPTAADGAGASLERTEPNGDPDSSANWRASAVSGGTPGKANAPTLRPSIRLNEVSAQPEPGADWVELFNSGASPAPIGGWSLTDQTSQPRKFVFPSGTQIPANGFLVIPCDAAKPIGGLNSSFGLNHRGETLALFDAQTNVVDVLDFGGQATGFTTSRLDPEADWQLGESTPGAPNEPATLGHSVSLTLNEFLADSETGDDWIELHNPSSLPVRLTGCYLGTPDVLFRIASPSFLEAGGFALLKADENPGPDHVDFKLPASGGDITLYDGNGSVIDRVAYGPQVPLVPIGRLPDGSGPWVTLPFSATPGSSNYLAAPGATLQVNEFMAVNSGSTLAPDGQVADWIELQNVTTDTMALDGFKLRVDVGPSWSFPARVQLAAQARLVIWATSRNLPAGALNCGHELPDTGGVLWVSDGQDRILDRVEFGSQIPNRTIGRVLEGWALLATPTPGQPNSEPLALGDPASVRFNEWLVLASPPEADWIELFNPGPAPVDLGGHFLTDDPSLSGLTNFTIAPLSFVPANGFVRFYADHDVTAGPNHLNFQLDQWGETIRLSSPTRTLVDQIDFTVQALGISEGRLPDGTSRITRLPWRSPLAPNGRSDIDLDQDSMPDVWEYTHGLNPDNPADAAADPDGDGWSNAQEFVAGTDPRDAASGLIVHTVNQNGQVHLRFTAIADRSYSVLFRDDKLDAVGWQKLTDEPAHETSEEVDLPDSIPGPNQPARFYRVVTPAVP